LISPSLDVVKDLCFSSSLTSVEVLTAGGVTTDVEQSLLRARTDVWFDPLSSGVGDCDGVPAVSSTDRFRIRLTRYIGDLGDFFASASSASVSRRRFSRSYSILLYIHSSMARFRLHSSDCFSCSLRTAATSSSCFRRAKSIRRYSSRRLT
jgi:hypothetical protein